MYAKVDQAVWILRADFGLLNVAHLFRKLHVIYCM